MGGCTSWNGISYEDTPCRNQISIGCCPEGRKIAISLAYLYLFANKFRQGAKWVHNMKWTRMACTGWRWTEHEINSANQGELVQQVIQLGLIGFGCAFEVADCEFLNMNAKTLIENVL